jgi:hypothetical protein
MPSLLSRLWAFCTPRRCPNVPDTESGEVAVTSTVLEIFALLRTRLRSAALRRVMG